MWKKQGKTKNFPHFSHHLCPKCKKRLEIWELGESFGEQFGEPILVCTYCDWFYDYYEFD